MYIILVNDDNSLIGSNRERIMQRSKLVDKLCFLVNPMYGDFDMSQFTCTMEYALPISKEYKTETLVLSSELYKEKLQYVLPIDTCLTKENGEVEVKLTFTFADMDADGNAIQRVRKTSSAKINILPIAAWSNLIPDEALSALDQRILKLDAQTKALADMNEVIMDTKADDINYNEEENSLQLTAENKPIGKKVTLKSSIDKEGIPVIDLNSDPVKPDFPDNEESDVVEF